MPEISVIKHQTLEDKLQEAIGRFSVTADKVQAIADSVSLWHDTIFHQKWNVLIGEPGSGKTALMIHCAADMALEGYDVLYFNLDAGAADLKYYQHHAETHNYRLLAAMDVGQSDEQMAEILLAHTQLDDLTNTVFILDTLKKFTDPVNKKVCKPFYAGLRQLTMRGGTVICLGHTNKYKDESGKLIYEGAGDLKSDCDVMAMLYQAKNDDGSMTISTEFEKQRAPVKPKTFNLSESRDLALAGEWQNVREEGHKERQEAKDTPTIEYIRSQIWGAPKSQSELVTLCKSGNMGGRNTVLRILRTYEGKHWTSHHAYSRNNERLYGIDDSC